MICRDEEEAERVVARLAEDVPVKNGAKGETEEFGDGVMVLPVSYTKGLEFDAVLLFDPSEKKYPSDNGHVKLLYVAATRALHELTILHRGELSGILAGRAPQDKHIKEFAAEPLTKAREYEKPVRTKRNRCSSAGWKAPWIWRSGNISAPDALRQKRLRRRRNRS